MTIKPIETVFDGYRFRSRLEARWAVFFKTLGVPYEYEKEGYDLDGTWYLPDFWLPEQNCWFEVKGKPSDTGPLLESFLKARALCRMTQKSVYVATGDIQIPRIDGDEQHNYHFMRMEAYDPFDPYITDDEYKWPSHPWITWMQCRICHKAELRPYFMGSHFADVLSCSCKKIRNVTVYDSPRLIEAYTAARQARFEHQDRRY